MTLNCDCSYALLGGACVECSAVLSTDRWCKNTAQDTFHIHTYLGTKTSSSTTVVAKTESVSTIIYPQPPCLTMLAEARVQEDRQR